MRCTSFDGRTRAALDALGFEISDSGEDAQLAGRMQIEIVRPADGDRLVLWVTLPIGESFTLSMPSGQLLKAAGLDEDDEAA